MEGAAVLHAARLLGARAVELRSISNRTGDRDQQDWRLPEAFAALKSAAAALSAI
jgi:futalosine hydrolase